MGPSEEFKKKYHERYLKAKQKGIKFFPDVIYKDLLVAFALFIVLVLLLLPAALGRGMLALKRRLRSARPTSHAGMLLGALSDTPVTVMPWLQL